MYRDKHFAAYARRVAKADAGMTIGAAGDDGLPETPNFEALRQTGAPHRKVGLSPSQAWINDDSPYLDAERRNRDYGGYRPAIGKYADPALQGADWRGKTPPPGETPKP